MLNSNSRLPGEAHIQYLDGDFDILERGDFVVCAVTGKKIPLGNLRYWNVETQEAYIDARTANEAMVPDFKKSTSE